MTDRVLEQIRQIAADVFALPVEEIDQETSPETLASWDSLKHIHLMMAIEQAFGIEIVPEEMAEMTSIRSTVRVVEKKLV